jgi:hypothetical protein
MSNANVVRVTRLAMKEISGANRASVARNERDDTRAIKITTGAAVGTHQLEIGLDGKQGRAEWMRD